MAVGFFGIVIAGLVALYTNAARLAQERWLARLDRLRDALDGATERLMSVHTRDDPHDANVEHALATISGELVAGRARLRLWLDETNDAVKAWEAAAEAILKVKRLLWSGGRDQGTENSTNEIVEEWAARARREIEQQEASVPSVWQVMLGKRP